MQKNPRKILYLVSIVSFLLMFSATRLLADGPEPKIIYNIASGGIPDASSISCELINPVGFWEPTIICNIASGGIPDASSFPRELTNVNGTLFFTAVSPMFDHLRPLWKSDGTKTEMVKLIGDSYFDHPLDLTHAGGLLFFTADDGQGRELWKSDGTITETVLVKDINPGIADSGITALTNANGTLFFSAVDGTHGREVWVSDGTTAGTFMLKDINPGGNSSISSETSIKFGHVNGTLFFGADDGAGGSGLWKSDGTSAGTVFIKGVGTRWLTNVNGTLFGAGLGLWKSDGTTAGTVMVKDRRDGYFEPELLTNVNGTLFFTADDGAHGRELWKSNGTTAGTVMVKDIRPGSAGSVITELVNVNGTLFFIVDDSAGVHAQELWKSDGTAAGTVLVKNINPSGGSDIRELTSVNTFVFFFANDGTHGHELWVSNGTSAGTSMVKDINTYGPTLPYFLTNVNGTLYFAADDGNYGQEVWKMEVGGSLPPPPLDITADHLEVTQAIQDLQDGVRLVANKRTLVRLHYSANQAEGWTKAKLTVDNGSKSTELAPVFVERPIHLTSDRASILDSFFFLLPREYTSGTVNLMAVINPDNSPGEPNHVNNTIEKTVSFEEVPPIDLALIGIGYENVSPPSTFHFNRLLSWLHRAYPIARRNQGMHVQAGTFRVDNLPEHPNFYILKLLLHLKKIRTYDIEHGISTNRTHYYGMFDSQEVRMDGSAPPPWTLFGPIAVGPTGVPGPSNRFGGWDTDGSYGDVLGGHEIAHTYGSHHANCGLHLRVGDPSYTGGVISPELTGDKAIYGFDSETFIIYPPESRDVMTYCGPVWISDITYHDLMNYIQSNPRIQPFEKSLLNQSDRLLIIGDIDSETNQVNLQPLFIIPNAGDIEPSTPGDYSIVLRNTLGDELARYPFTQDEVNIDTFQDSSDTTSSLLLISELVPYIPGTDQVDIEHQGTVLHTITAGSATPTVTVTSPNGGATLTGSTVDVNWTASDPDNDPLYFNVQYSADNGQTWEMMGTTITDTSMAIPADNIVGSNEGLFRVWVSDGIHTASDQSDATVTVPNHIPEIEIINPTEPITRLINQTLALEANAYDIDSGSMPAEQLQWISDIDGLLGDGAQLSITGLSLGTHTITFQADDGQGGLVSETATVTIVDDPALVRPPNGLAVGPTLVVLDQALGGTSDTLSIYNQNVTRVIDWNVVASESWLQLSQTSGSTPGRLTITVDDTDLAEGNHFATITVTSPDLPGQSVEVPVSVAIVPPSNIYLPIVLK